MLPGLDQMTIHESHIARLNEIAEVFGITTSTLQFVELYDRLLYKGAPLDRMLHAIYDFY
jgi:hypothetical protein